MGIANEYTVYPALPCEQRFGYAGDVYLNALILSFPAYLFNLANRYSVGILAKYGKYSMGDRNIRQRLCNRVEKCKRDTLGLSVIMLIKSLHLGTTKGP